MLQIQWDYDYEYTCRWLSWRQWCLSAPLQTQNRSQTSLFYSLMTWVSGIFKVISNSKAKWFPFHNLCEPAIDWLSFMRLPTFPVYGHPTTSTPHLNKLAAEGTRFTVSWIFNLLIYYKTRSHVSCKSALVFGKQFIHTFGDLFTWTTNNSRAHCTYQRC